MNAAANTLERAFELARTRRYRGMTELRHQLHREGFRDHERALFGISIRRQLQALMPAKSPA